MDTSGSRFLNRFAGSDDFQNRLNRSKRAPAEYSSRTPGDFTKQSSSSDSRMGPGSFAGQTQIDKQYNNDGKDFNRQVVREKYLEDNDIAQGNSGFNTTDFMNKYMSYNRQAQAGRSDGSSIANKYIQKARETNPIDIVALDKHVRRTPLYSEAKSQIEGLLVYGDKYKNARENPVSWSQPVPTPDVETPDFGSIYDKTKNDINSIKY
tara:strand:+ start:931 stop:1554 length:624 start_codon:yes stop_codon:yes gene_type:complete